MEKPKINVGDRVAYAANFLRSTGILTGLGHLRGTVRAVEADWGEGQSLLKVEWDACVGFARCELPNPRFILESNLTLVSRLAEDAALADRRKP